ncbi:sensor histidine kinase [Actinoplanes subtropicus]|uniref:sensor histidine kinase n=1 Tax=Actinoplanes subtropicus TaxID=543632 RepID=UPI0004C35C4F|nr:histidine kinase [Actinoplanes subtropicus]
MRHWQRMADVGTAVAVLVAAQLTTSAGHHLRDPIAVGLAALACAPLAGRRRWPYPALLVSTVAAEGYLTWVHHGGGGTLILAAPLIALYTVVETGTRRRSLWAAAAVVLLIGVLHTVVKSGRWLGPENLALAALGGLAVAAGEASRNRRAYEAEALLRAQEKVTAERLRIARDLHDSVGHHLALINVQAGVAAHVLPADPAHVLPTGPVRRGSGLSTRAEEAGAGNDAVRETLDQIRQSARDALDELRDAVGLLRRPDEPLAPVEPTLGLAGLDDLLATFERAGLRITCRREEDGHLPPAADVVAYRVVQESLTNARKHAGQVDVRLVLRFRGPALSIVVENDGPPAPARPESHGLTGMRERVSALGGTLTAEPRPLGGFRVSCRLPAEAAA